MALWAAGRVLAVVGQLAGALGGRVRRGMEAVDRGAPFPASAHAGQGPVVCKAPVFQIVLDAHGRAEAQPQAPPPTPPAEPAPGPVPVPAPPPPEGRGAARPGAGWVEYTVKRGDTLWALAGKKFRVSMEDLMRDNRIEDPRTLRIGQRLRVRLPSVPREQQVVASWYGEEHHGRIMANGEPFNMHGATIAHKQLPFGTRVELLNAATGQRVTAVVTDRGPFIAGRDVDLSYGLARKLSLVERGVGPLTMRVLG